VDAKETQRLLLSALGGNTEELGVLLDRLRPRLVLWCAARMSPELRSHLDPEDAAQEILTAVFKDFRTYRGPADKPFFKWFFVLADHKLKDVVDYYGAKKRQKIEPMSFSQTSPSQAAANVEMVTRLHQAISRLPDDHRLVVQLFKLESREIGDVAEIMGRSENAVRILYCRALKALRGLLESPPGGAS
jgi:RNA polymerase sigma-70 factor (ECF subfamily)